MHLSSVWCRLISALCTSQSQRRPINRSQLSACVPVVREANGGNVSQRTNHLHLCPEAAGGTWPPRDYKMSNLTTGLANYTGTFRKIHSCHTNCTFQFPLKSCWKKPLPFHSTQDILNEHTNLFNASFSTASIFFLACQQVK